MNEAELRSAYEAQKPQLEAWGEMIREAVCIGISKAIEPARPLGYFLKVPPLVRVKDTESFLGKALRRGKDYKRPLDQITDRVGLRFVVLLLSDVAIVQEVIESGTLWEQEIARDFEAEQAERPHHFDYQSVHYIVRPIRPYAAGAVTIPAGLPCEVQVRTLLQHAYAELAHDTTYKPSMMVDRTILRTIAKGSALVETADDTFMKVAEQLAQASAEVRRVHELAARSYPIFVGREAVDDVRLSFAMLDRYRPVLSSITEELLCEFLRQNSFIAQKIHERAPLSLLYRHPAVLIVYFLAESDSDLLAQGWAFDLKYLAYIYADLGISGEGRVW